jgi:hypothetical protein
MQKKKENTTRTMILNCRNVKGGWNLSIHTLMNPYALCGGGGVGVLRIKKPTPCYYYKPIYIDLACKTTNNFLYLEPYTWHNYKTLENNNFYAFSLVSCHALQLQLPIISPCLWFKIVVCRSLSVIGRNPFALCSMSNNSSALSKT